MRAFRRVDRCGEVVLRYSGRVDMPQCSHQEPGGLMKLISLITSIMLVVAPSVFAQSNEQLVETVRSSAVEVFLEQASWVLPDSFHNSDLAESEKERVVLQLANDTADCLAGTAVEYSDKYNIPIPDFVSGDGTIHFDGESGREFSRLLELCVNSAWQAAGVSRN